MAIPRLIPLARSVWQYKQTVVDVLTIAVTALTAVQGVEVVIGNEQLNAALASIVIALNLGLRLLGARPGRR